MCDSAASIIHSIPLRSGRTFNRGHACFTCTHTQNILNDRIKSIQYSLRSRLKSKKRFRTGRPCQETVDDRAKRSYQTTNSTVCYHAGETFPYGRSPWKTCTTHSLQCHILSKLYCDKGATFLPKNKKSVNMPFFIKTLPSVRCKKTSDVMPYVMPYRA